MSLYVAESGFDYGLKTSGLIDHNSTYTWMAWCDIVSDTNGYGHIWAAIGDTSSAWQNADWVGTDSDGTSVRIGCAISGTESAGVGGSFTVGTPKHIAVVRGSTSTFQLYENGSASATANQSISGRASTQREQLGTLNALRAPARLTAMKCWQAALTAEEIAAEMRSIRPLRLANLHSWHPALASSLTIALKDFSGNGRDWTNQGSLSVANETPPVSWGNRPVLILPVNVLTPQTIAPVSDVAAGSWTPSSGSDLYAMLDEAAASDTDYIQATSATTCTLALASGSDPSSSTGHILRYRLLAGSGKIAVTLKQGTTTLASWGPHTLTGAAQDFAQTLTGGEADSITDYSALRVEFTSALA